MSINMKKSYFLLIFACFISPHSFSMHHGNNNGNISPAKHQLEYLVLMNRRLQKPPSTATNHHGRPIPSLTASQAVKGELLMRDVLLLDKLSHFNRERIPERVAHAKGASAQGIFTVTNDIAKYTKAKFLNGLNKKTPVTVRFSTTVGERGSPDTVVDGLGFATKFYTKDGNFDLVGNNLEVFPIRDPSLFPDLVHSRKKNPVTNLVDHTMWWDFVAHRTETTLHTIQLFSDLGRPESYRKMDGFGVHAFKMVNEKDQGVYVKFHWKTNQTVQSMNHTVAAQLTGTNPDYRTADLYDAIAKREFPMWGLYIQVMTEAEAEKSKVNPFDVTKFWSQSEYPLIPVGLMQLDKNPENFFAQVEQLGFSPGNMVPGIEASPDKMLISRMFSYGDAQRYRMGVNYPQIPINAPINKASSYMRDGKSCHRDNGGGYPNYYPNSFGGHAPDPAWASETEVKVNGVGDRYDIPEDDAFLARAFLTDNVDDAHKKRLVGALADHLSKANPEIRDRVLKNIIYPISAQFGDEVRQAVKNLVLF